MKIGIKSSASDATAIVILIKIYGRLLYGSKLGDTECPPASSFHIPNFVVVFVGGWDLH